MRSLFATCLLVGAAVAGSPFDFVLQTNQQPDEVNRVVALDAEQTLQTSPLAIVFIKAEGAQTPVAAEQLAQVLAGRKSPVAVFTGTTGLLQGTTEGEVYAFRTGRRFAYHGIREVAPLLKFLSSLETSSVKTITGKLDKVAFDHTRGTKLVGFFAAASAELKTFEEAASLFANQVSFFIITDPLVAKHLKMNATGQIHLVREFERHPVVCPANPATLVDIQQLIVFNRDSLVKVTPMNILDPSLSSKPAFLMLTDSSSPLAFHLLKLIGRMQRANHASSTSSQKTTGATASTTPAPLTPATTAGQQQQQQHRILWLDTADFPSYDAATLTGGTQPTAVPAFGFWDPNVTAPQTQWMDLALLNQAPADKIQEEANLLLIRNFIFVHSAAATTASPKTEL